MPFLPALVPLIAGLAGSTAGALAKGRAAGRQAEAQQNAAQDAQRLQFAQFNRAAPQARAGAAVHGDILANLQPYRLSGEGRTLSSTGGLSPSLLSQDTRQLGGNMSRQALMSQLGRLGSADPYTTAGPTPLPRASWLDKLLGGVGIGGSLLGMTGGGSQGPFGGYTKGLIK